MDVGRNPFLFDDPGQVDEMADMASNPFLSGGGFDSGSTDFGAINPFSDNVDDSSINFFDSQGPYPNDMNPFGELPQDNTTNLFNIEPPLSNEPQLDIFGTVSEKDDSFSTNTAIQNATPKAPPRPPSPARDLLCDSSPIFSTAQTTPGRPPPPRPPPPSKETKELLQTVIGAMDANTDTLQGKLMTTRTPCPSPNSGIQNSRSPTPDIQITGPDKEPDAFSTVFGKTIELSEEELEENQPVVSKPEPEPPAEAEVDLFGETVCQPKTKTNQDILSLFNKPKDAEKIDLLSEDLPEVDVCAEDVINASTNEDIKPMDQSSMLISEDVLKSEDIPSQPIENTVSESDSSVTKESSYEPTASPELTSEKSDSEPTVIESGMSQDRRKSSTQICEEGDMRVSDCGVPLAETQGEIFGSIEPSPPSVQPEVEIPLEASDKNVTDESTVDPMGSDIFGVPPTTQFEPTLDVKDPGVIDNNTFVSPEFSSMPQSSSVTDFGPEGLFGDAGTSQEQTTAKVDEPEMLPSPPSSSAFDVFGRSAPPVPVSSAGAETTGAALFETATPAPNVGVSLFGGGEEASLDIFAESHSNTMVNPFAATPQRPTEQSFQKNVASEEEFDAFSARFDNVSSANLDTTENVDPFTSTNRASSPWGATNEEGTKKDAFGFDDNAQFDPFLCLSEPPPAPQSTPRKHRQTSDDSEDGQMNVVIRPAALDSSGLAAASPVPVLAPPPVSATSAFTDTVPKFNPFEYGMGDASSALPPGVTALPLDGSKLERTDSQETPPTPLFEEDQSVPLEPFPRTSYDGRTWEMFLRQPNKKKITGQRFWKKVYVKMTSEGALQLYNNKDDKEAFQELPLQPCYSVSDIGAQQFDQFGKIFTVKIQYIFYKERPGVRPGQISKAERITTRLSKFAQYAIAGDFEGVKEFASDVRKLGMPVEHAPQISQLLKLGTQNYEDLKLFASLIEEHMFQLVSTRDRALSYKTEEVQLTAVDELYLEQDLNGAVLQMVARVRIFFLGFLSGMPEVDLGINDLKKQGHEVVGRHDIIPVITEEWIRLEDIEFHCTVDQEEFEKTRHIKFKPPDACYIELMRYRVRPPKNRELPLQVKTKFIIQGKRVDIQCEILVPGFSGRKLGQVPCEDVAVRFPLPECWIYLFRVEKHFRYGSVKSAHRRTGKVKGIERLKGTVESAEAALMEVTSGQAKYEHQHRAIVWRMPRLPKEGQGAYTVHQFTCRMTLTSFDQMPESFDKYCVVEFTMPATTVSHCVMRSVSVTNDDPPEKYVRYLARHEYKTEIEFATGSSTNEYIAATMKATDASSNGDDSSKKVDTLEEESSSDDSS